MMQKLYSFLIELLKGTQLSSDHTIATANSLIIILVVIIAYITYAVFRPAFNLVINKIIRKSKTDWDDALVDRGVINKLAQIFPAVFLSYTVDFFDATIPQFGSFISILINLYYIAIFTMVFVGFFNAAMDIYNKYPFAKKRPIKGFIQLFQLIFIIIGIILAISVLFDIEVAGILSALGALAAVLMFVFKDTLLSFVASIQLTANKMVKLGDWIEVPEYGADGVIEDISINTVKVRNWDKTIITMPVYAMVSGGIKNWAGMEESGGRRIKRHINIDITSVKFCDSTLKHELGKIDHIADYIKENIDQPLTNIGVFKRYIELYLKKHPKISDNLTLLVRQLQSTEKGIPIEIYGFSTDQEWANYETIQADMIAHLIASLNMFELRAFQLPSDYTISKLER